MTIFGMSDFYVLLSQYLFLKIRASQNYHLALIVPRISAGGKKGAEYLETEL